MEVSKPNPVNPIKYDEASKNHKKYYCLALAGYAGFALALGGVAGRSYFLEGPNPPQTAQYERYISAIEEKKGINQELAEVRQRLEETFTVPEVAEYFEAKYKDSGELDSLLNNAGVSLDSLINKLEKDPEIVKYFEQYQEFGKKEIKVIGGAGIFGFASLIAMFQFLKRKDKFGREMMIYGPVKKK